MYMCTPNVISCQKWAKKLSSMIKISHFSLQRWSWTPPLSLLPFPAHFSIFPSLAPSRGIRCATGQSQKQTIWGKDASGPGVRNHWCTLQKQWLGVFTAACYSRFHIPARDPWIVPFRGKFHVTFWHSGWAHAKWIFFSQDCCKQSSQLKCLSSVLSTRSLDWWSAGI